MKAHARGTDIMTTRTRGSLRRELGLFALIAAFLWYLVPLLVLLFLLREFAPVPVRPDDRGPPLSMNREGDGGGAGEDGGAVQRIRHGRDATSALRCRRI